MADVVSLRGDAPEGSGIVNHDLVGELERLLEGARSGDIVAFGYFGVRANRHVFTGWEGADRGYTYELSHGINVVNYRLMRANVHTEEGMTTD